MAGFELGMNPPTEEDVNEIYALFFQTGSVLLFKLLCVDSHLMGIDDAAAAGAFKVSIKNFNHSCSII